MIFYDKCFDFVAALPCQMFRVYREQMSLHHVAPKSSTVLWQVTTFSRVEGFTQDEQVEIETSHRSINIPLNL